VHNKIPRIASIEKANVSVTLGETVRSDAPALPKRDAILEAAANVFMEQGFEPASMDEVARLAGVSKATIYSHFESKQALFGAIITGRCTAMIPIIEAAALGDQSPAEALRIIGRRFLDLLMSKGPLALYRIVLSEAGRFPELGRSFYESGPNRIASALADYLARQHALGVLDAPRPRVAAEQFFGMVLGQIHVRLLLGITDAAPGPEEREQLVDLAVGTFLNGVMRR
jgi:TetR/AcrR family transcriptional regulator, mexJK operon transcriptional repressor